MSATASRTVLAAVDGAIAIEVLRELHRVCRAMDAEQPECGGASEAEYQVALAAAAEVLQRHPITERMPTA